MISNFFKKKKLNIKDIFPNLKLNNSDKIIDFKTLSFANQSVSFGVNLKF